MNRIVCPIVLCLAASAAAKEPCVSGPQIGQRPGPYSFLVATGPQRGQQTCYVCETADKAAVIVFVRSLSAAPLPALLEACDKAVAARPANAFRGWMTVLGEKTVGIDDLAKWAKNAGVKSVPVGVFDDAVGPPSYQIADEADVTVLVFAKRKVVHNFAFRTGELKADDVKKIADAIDKVAPVK